MQIPESPAEIPSFSFKPGMKVIVKPAYGEDCPDDRGAQALVGKVGKVIRESPRQGFILVRFPDYVGHGPRGSFHFEDEELGIAPEEGG